MGTNWKERNGKKEEMKKKKGKKGGGGHRKIVLETQNKIKLTLDAMYQKKVTVIFQLE